ncbi:MAG: tryptophan synthase subunit alpha [Chloroflexi bacterium]|nr:tryptophan synthase subunit alpha [Chloroflexota bacterium]
MPSPRIAEAFQRMKRQGKTGLILYVTVGFPDVQTTLELAPALEVAGADIVELGVPFSDPLADGATIQKASYHALGQGVTLRRCLAVAAELRGRGFAVPLILMGYYNPILALGVNAFVRQAQASGVDGLIVPDLPPEESGPLKAATAELDIDLICLLAPTSTERRIAEACASASGFIYCVSLAGVTGARDQVSSEGQGLVERVRRHTRLPVAVGFGIARREHVEAVGRYAEAAVIGSALVNVLDQASPGRAVAEAVQFVKELRGEAQGVYRGTA